MWGGGGYGGSCTHRAKFRYNATYHPKASGDHPQAFGKTRQSGLRWASSPGKISRNINKVPPCAPCNNTPMAWVWVGPLCQATSVPGSWPHATAHALEDPGCLFRSLRPVGWCRCHLRDRRTIRMRPAHWTALGQGGTLLTSPCTPPRALFDGVPSTMTRCVAYQ